MNAHGSKKSLARALGCGVWIAAVIGCGTAESTTPAESEPGAQQPQAETRTRPLPTVLCRTDSDCRTFSDYCEGCDCLALGRCDPDPVCKTEGVQCLVDPCSNQQAVCTAGRCSLRPQGVCARDACGPPLGLPNRLCPDGTTVAGPSGRCLRQPGGTCSWEIVQCPKDPPASCTQ